MQIKRFEAKNMTEAFRHIKQEFGSDAVILSARTLRYKKGLFDLTQGGGVEVMAATDKIVIKPDKYVSHRQVINNYSDKKEGIDLSGMPDKNGFFQSISTKFQPIRNMRFRKNKEARNISDDIGELEKLKEHLIMQGIEEDIGQEIIERLYEIQYSKKSKNGNDARANLIRVLDESGIQTTPIKKEVNKQNIIALIGLTGVGKTTTLVKLASLHILELDHSVGVISLDTFRVASNTLLNVYANIIGFPVECVTNSKEVKTVLKKFKNKQIILIDTPGISLNDNKQQYKVKELLDNIRPDEIHLLMHTNTKNSDAEEIIKKFNIFKFDQLLFTKLDETTTCGTIINQLVEAAMPISYITTGQNIPEDITNVELDTLVSLLLETKESNKVIQSYTMQSNGTMLKHGLYGIGNN